MRSIMDVSLQEAVGMPLKEIDAMTNAELEKLSRDHERRNTEFAKLRKKLAKAIADRDMEKVHSINDQILDLIK